MKTVHLFISGFVQGVGFRYFVKKRAVQLGLSGWVRNTSNGKVETVLQGAEENVQKMIRLCGEGPFLSEVKEAEIIQEDTKEIFEGFDIRK